MIENLNLPSGDVYKKNYEQKKELGRGKFGLVFQVQDKVTKQIFAAKHIKTRTKTQKEKAMEEVFIMKKLSDPHIISFVAAYETPSELIFIMEYLDGGELFDKVADEDFILTEVNCCLFLKQICMGVEYLHSNNIVHLDLKPENIVCTDKKGTNVKIIDFGAAKELDPLIELRAMCGTPEFLSPEVVNYDVIDTATDMWSVGVICYILLSGYSPFEGDSDAETSSNITSVKYDFELDEFDIISENAMNFISQLLKKNMSQRMTASQCLEHEWLLEQDIGHSVIKTDKLRRFLARRRWQRCGQAIRALNRMSSLMIKKRSIESEKSPYIYPITSTEKSDDVTTCSEPPQLHDNQQNDPQRTILLKQRLKEEFGGHQRVFRTEC
eukprot:GFUD01027856.1.p1 GENE.GFUD01027856.1~~GFUD01027856.1.p1  ORF type:complete len:392 (+),score=90.66 GFUD01027856.1:31-1176(+)